MAEQNRTTLKSYFETGDTPTEAQFEDLIDSVPNISDSSVSNTEFSYLNGVTSAIQTQINGKQDELTGLTASVTELNYSDGVTSSIQTQLDGKLTDVVDDTTPQLGGNLDLNGNNIGNATAADLTKLNEITATSTELNYVDGVTSAIQTQIDGKADLSGATFTGDINLDGNDLSNIDQITQSHSGSGTGVSFTHSGTGNGVVITKTNSGDALDVVSGSVRFQQLTADRWLFIDSNNRVTVKTNAELLSAIGAITEVSEDTTPQLGGSLDAQNYNITSVQNITADTYTNTQQALSIAGGSSTFDYDNGLYATITLTENTIITLENIANGMACHLLVIQDDTGDWTLELENVQWAGGSAPTFTAAAGAKDLVKITVIGNILVGEVIAQNIS